MQKIPYNGSNIPYISEDGNYLILNKLYKWNALINQYEGRTDFEYPLNITQFTGVSQDLKTIITQQMIYILNGETYTSYRLDMVGLSSPGYLIRISDVLSDGTRFVISSIYTKVMFCILNGTTLTYVQNIESF